MAWLKEHAIPFRSTNPADDDFADLEPLRTVIGDARIVQLGEPSHGDGTCFETKIRLIRFLHQELGFEVLAFESGLYDCHRAWQAFQAGGDPLESAELGVFGIWTGSAQTRSLWEYLSESAQSQNPLELAGFDCQFTASASSRFLPGDLVQLARDSGAGLTAEEEEWLQNGLQQLVQNEIPDDSFDRLFSPLERIARAVERSDNKSIDRPFWKQELRSLLVNGHAIRNQNGDSPGSEDINARDRQMAENLVWLANERHRSKKIIVWAASFHIARNLGEMTDSGPAVDYGDIVPMGHTVHSVLGKDVFSIAFTAFEGHAGAWFRPRFPLDAAPGGTIESLCAEAGLENGLIPFSNNGKDVEWLRSPLHARPLGYAWMKSVWPQHFDALIFHKVMTPSTPR